MAAGAKKKGGRKPVASAHPINPKDIAALDRVPMWSLPAIGAIHGAQATRDGIQLYGPYNWRNKPISLMEYLGAIERHIACLKDGEDFTIGHDGRPVHHLGCINANTAIILDAEQCGMLIDDRPVVPGRAAETLEDFKHDSADRRARASRAKKAKVSKRKRGTKGR
jgi:hypothetical protein